MNLNDNLNKKWTAVEKLGNLNWIGLSLASGLCGIRDFTYRWNYDELVYNPF
jgi:hypothetical protein